MQLWAGGKLGDWRASWGPVLPGRGGGMDESFPSAASWLRCLLSLWTLDLDSGLSSAPEPIT